MLATRLVVTAVAMTMPTFMAVVSAMTVMTTMVIVIVMAMMAVMEQRIESDEGGDRRHVVATVVRIRRCAGQRQGDQATDRHDA